MKIKYLLIALFCVGVMNAQVEDPTKHKVLKVTYTAFPLSTYDTPPEDSDLAKNYSDIVALAQGYQHMYSLYVDLKTNKSFYKLDTLVVNKPKGREAFNYQINHNLEFVVKDESNKFSKFEKIFQREFYSNGDLSNIEWDITDEKKVIAGLNCRKAVPKNKDYLLNVWYTEDINISNGPASYFGLPGLVVFSEDFFWTTEIKSVSYEDNFDFKGEYDALKSKFDKSKEGKSIKEGILIEKKNKLVKSMIDQMNNR